MLLAIATLLQQHHAFAIIVDLRRRRVSPASASRLQQHHAFAIIVDSDPECAADPSSSLSARPGP